MINIYSRKGNENKMEVLVVKEVVNAITNPLVDAEPTGKPGRCPTLLICNRGNVGYSEQGEGSRM